MLQFSQGAGPLLTPPFRESAILLRGNLNTTVNVKFHNDTDQAFTVWPDLHGKPFMWIPLLLSNMHNHMRGSVSVAFTEKQPKARAVSNTLGAGELGRYLNTGFWSPISTSQLKAFTFTSLRLRFSSKTKQFCLCVCFFLQVLVGSTVPCCLTHSGQPC